jgi:hypothetical protein
VEGFFFFFFKNFRFNGLLKLSFLFCFGGIADRQASMLCEPLYFFFFLVNSFILLDYDMIDIPVPSSKGRTSIFYGF